MPLSTNLSCQWLIIMAPSRPLCTSWECGTVFGKFGYESIPTTSFSAESFADHPLSQIHRSCTKNSTPRRRQSIFEHLELDTMVRLHYPASLSSIFTYNQHQWPLSKRRKIASRRDALDGKECQLQIIVCGKLSISQTNHSSAFKKRT